ncbi:hypothetical protein FXF51_09135 [Nonomuraea sp. PA05]|nr:hypothetical protein FXF51_09135 [Nonomuraea sp. PA05]
MQPLVYLRYDLGLDLDNSAGRGPHRIKLHACHEEVAAKAPRITSIKVQVSFDGEKTWQAGRQHRQPDGARGVRRALSIGKVSPREVGTHDRITLRDASPRFHRSHGPTRPAAQHLAE